MLVTNQIKTNNIFYDFWIGGFWLLESLGIFYTVVKRLKQLQLNESWFAN